MGSSELHLEFRLARDGRMLSERTHRSRDRIVACMPESLHVGGRTIST
jgi:hypothetical protein